MNLDITIGEFIKSIDNKDFTKLESASADINFAIADLSIETIYVVMNAVKMARFAVNYVNADNIYLMSMRDIALLATQAEIVRLHAIWSLSGGVYL
jgi:hypothetical protein